MTRFRSRLAVAALAVLAAGCAGTSGARIAALPPGDLANAYIPLKHPFLWVVERDAGAVVLGNGIAVTAGHAAHMLPADRIIGSSVDYDLTFFRTDRAQAALASDLPHAGERVATYAHFDDDLYRAEGVVISTDAPVKPQCGTCTVQEAFAFEGNAGPGYSGGPVLDAQTGKLVGIVFGYVDKDGGGRLIYAYPMRRVLEELQKVERK